MNQGITPDQAIANKLDASAVICHERFPTRAIYQCSDAAVVSDCVLGCSSDWFLHLLGFRLADGKPRCYRFILARLEADRSWHVACLPDPSTRLARSSPASHDSGGGGLARKVAPAPGPAQ